MGRVAAGDLHEGSLLVEADLFAEGEKLVDTNEAVVGVRVGVGAAPVELARGRGVLAVIRPTATGRGGEGAAGEPRSVEGWVLDVKDVDAGAGQAIGSMSVSVVVPATRPPWWRTRARMAARSRRWRSDVPVLAMVSAKGRPG